MKKYSFPALIWLLLLSLLLCGCDFLLEFVNEPVRIPDGEIRLDFLDVGQGDCTLIRTEDACILVDTGDKNSADTQKIINYLTAAGVSTIDYLVLTHPHADHIGGAPQIIRAFTITHCLMPDASASTMIFDDTLAALEEGDVDVVQAVAGTDITLGDMRMEIFGPVGTSYDETNDYSVVFRLVYGTTAVMMTGDAETLSEREILNRFGGTALSADILKIGHHGSDTSTGTDFLAAVAPTFGIISVGAGNSYGHPKASVLAALAEADVTVYRTDLHGTVVFIGDGTTFTRLDGAS